jgi:hypothetical protein
MPGSNGGSNGHLRPRIAYSPSATLGPILGGYFISKQTSHEFAALRIGKDVWSKYELADQLKVTNTTSAAALSKWCKKRGITSTVDLYRKTDKFTFAHGERAGETFLYVMFAAFRAKGLNVREWYHRDPSSKLVTWNTLKQHDRDKQAEKREQKHARQAGTRGTSMGAAS